MRLKHPVRVFRPGIDSMRIGQAFYQVRLGVTGAGLSQDETLRRVQQGLWIEDTSEISLDSSILVSLDGCRETQNPSIRRLLIRVVRVALSPTSPREDWVRIRHRNWDVCSPNYLVDAHGVAAALQNPSDSLFDVDSSSIGTRIHVQDKYGRPLLGHVISQVGGTTIAQTSEEEYLISSRGSLDGE